MISKPDAGTNELGVHEPFTVEPPPKPRARWARGIGVVAAVLVLGLIVGWLAWPTDNGDDAEARVRQYLEAIRAGDLDAAEGMRVESVEIDNDQLLNSAALDTNWTVEYVGRLDGGANPYEAEVRAVIRSAQGEESSFDLTLTKPRDSEQEQDFLVFDGLVRLSFVGDRVWDGLHLNDRPVKWSDSESPGSDTLLLYPGVYRFGHAFEGYMDVEFAERVLAQKGHKVTITGEDPDETGTQKWLFNEDGIDAAQDALDSHIEDCTDQSKAIKPGCPFGVEEARSSTNPEVDFSHDELSNINWDITKSPQVAVVEELGHLQFETVTAGAVRLTATGESEGVRGNIDLECEVTPRHMGIVVADGGDIEIIYDDDFEEEPMWWDTCPERTSSLSGSSLANST